MRRTGIAGVAAALAAAVLAGCGGGTSRADYEADVQDARDRVDSSLAFITQAQSREDLLERMDEASAAIDRAADDLDGAGAADGFGDENDRLVGALRELSADLAATAEQIRQPEFQDLMAGTQGLSFESWTEANRVLEQLDRQGIEVQPLARH